MYWHVSMRIESPAIWSEMHVRIHEYIMSTFICVSFLDFAFGSPYRIVHTGYFNMHFWPNFNLLDLGLHAFLPIFFVLKTQNALYLELCEVYVSKIFDLQVVSLSLPTTLIHIPGRYNCQIVSGMSEFISD